MKTGITGTDLFCGGGGWSEGIKAASRRLGLSVERLICLNHWMAAVNTHSANHPDAQHICDDTNRVDPAEFGKLDFVIASPECTHFSIARGGKPTNEQKRIPAGHVANWIYCNRPEFFAIENVPQFVDWGPLDKNDKLIKSSKGETFQEKVVNPIREMGYSVDHRVLCCADYGDPTTRRRLFICGRRDGAPVQWPEPTHSRQPEKDGLEPWVPARDIIDWSIPGTSIFNRKKPLCAKTLRRIEIGIRKFWGPWAEPFLVVLKGQSTAVSIDAPLPTLCTGEHMALAQPFLIPQQRGWDGLNVQSIASPMPTITSKGAEAVCEPFIVEYYGNGIDQPQSVDSPLPTVTCRDRFGVVQQFGLDIHYRMLQPHELAAAMGFPPSYRWYGTKTQVVRQIGNAVPVNTAAALVECLVRQTILRKKVAA